MILPLLFIALLALPTISTPAPDDQSDLGTLASRLTGSFSRQEQAAADTNSKEVVL